MSNNGGIIFIAIILIGGLIVAGLAATYISGSLLGDGSDSIFDTLSDLIKGVSDKLGFNTDNSSAGVGFILTLEDENGDVYNETISPYDAEILTNIVTYNGHKVLAIQPTLVFNIQGVPSGETVNFWADCSIRNVIKKGSSIYYDKSNSWSDSTFTKTVGNGEVAYAAASVYTSSTIEPAIKNAGSGTYTLESSGTATVHYKVNGGTEQTATVTTGTSSVSFSYSGASATALQITASMSIVGINLD